MNLESVFHCHGHVQLSQDLSDSIVNHTWPSLDHSHNDNPLRPALIVNFPLVADTIHGGAAHPQPLMAQAVAILDQVQTVLPDLICLKAMIINLPAHRAQHWHVDPRVVHELSHRIHVAITTNDQAMMETCSGHQHFAVGEIWELNNMIPHRANNAGRTDRIHLVSDWIEPQILEQRQQELWQHRPDIVNNLGTRYQSLSGQCAPAMVAP